MSMKVNGKLGFDELDELVRPAPEVVEFEEVAHKMVSRRGFLSGGAAVGAGAFVMGSTTLAAGKALAAGHAESRLAFDRVKANTLDTITVPTGYKWEVLASWGDPLFSNAPAFNGATGGTGASQELAFGDHNDGMAFFSKNGTQVMAINNEYTNENTLHPTRAEGMPTTPDDVRKNKAAHGVSIIEVSQRGGKWGIVQDSPYNRRITADTEMDITGPARGHQWMQTSEDPKGQVAKGTWNNCGNGQTPWGTYLTCEENFNGYFTASKADYVMPDAYKRYGLSTQGRYNWAMADDRFDLVKEPNEPNRFGYIVEIDPMDPTSRPKKRTALGRFKHENAELTIASDGHVVVYLGDDERGEFLYRFISKHKYLVGGDNRDLLEEGTLYVAKFHDNNRGEWLALTPNTTGMTEAEIAIHTRMAASKVGATTMDRPEWVAAHPHKAEIYCSLTNNKNRGVKPNAGGDATPASGVNPRVKNNFGQIVRWTPMEGDHTHTQFKWDLFVLAGNPAVYDDAYAGSSNLNQDNMFNSPDGLKFDSKGLLWIQTDGNYSNEKEFKGQGNNQMLVGDPETGEIRRFLVGPKESEITGAAWNTSRTTMFISVQHPGEKGHSHWPDGGNSVPRSSVIAISREDGAVIG
ncbi:PhoX family protein [Marinomonas algarum]|uniref:PhoX family phosphatase n=1 Tax=Marinomonas algarum TaxID=2883105 RepID=A0A9X1LE63_9GAMM|nr:PhoX family phosphatase [Marinomonas algarum]MCB5160841.1 PhoX family phosphatase [Marinomonas algarum]